MDDAQAAKLRELAERATRGKWELLHGLGVYCKGRILASTHTAVEPGGHNHDAAYIAALSPDVVTALLDERDAMRRERDEAVSANKIAYRAIGVQAQKLGAAMMERDAAMALLREAVEFWAHYSSVNEGEQDDMAAERNDMLDRMRALLGGGGEAK